MGWRSEHLSSENATELGPLLGLAGWAEDECGEWLQRSKKRGLVGISRHRGPYVGAFAFDFAIDGTWPVLVIPWIVCIELTHRRRTFAALIEQIEKLAISRRCRQVELRDVRGQALNLNILFRRPPWRCSPSRVSQGLRIDTIALRQLRNAVPPLIG